MQTHECFDWILNKYKDEFTAKELAEAAGIPTSTISSFRKGKKNAGIEIFDKLRSGLRQVSPHAYLHLHCLMAEEELDVVKLAAMAPLQVQGEILKAIGSNGVFRHSSDNELTASIR
ncbi:helix-turn-helix domain-containing protein [Trichocoleus sp. DQ-A3]|uniref:helix-turn-helix domain-containing protein n=1 Tax=Cyanophyceae TaxID=3028117 RepID=UPI0016869627|nr:helix-turn-helix transcriptional regulator [Coleofasciculus sp. FACHB-125]MBD1899475.1 helix-turn-helix transcriptional regulator [Coleofasciculus sp. FACHB-125]